MRHELTGRLATATLFITRSHQQKGCLNDIRVDVPETESLVPGAGQSELTVGRNDHVRHEVVVASERTHGTADGLSVRRGIRIHVPHQNGLVCKSFNQSLGHSVGHTARSRDDSSGRVAASECGDLRHPAGVPVQGSDQLHLLLHHLRSLNGGGPKLLTNIPV